MKKFLALLVALSLVAFAGSAFATTITANPTAVTLTAGETATATVTGTASHGGELSYAISGPSWARLDGTTVTFAPSIAVTANTYTATVTVTETYGDSSSAGHTRPQTDTATVNISVTVNAIPVPALTFTATADTTSIVAGESVTVALASTGGAGSTSFTSTTDGVSISGTTAVFTPASAGTYELVFLASDAAGTTITRTITVTVYAPLAVTARVAKNPISVDETVSIALSSTGGIGTVTFSSATSGVTVTGNTATFRASAPNTYTLTFTAADNAGHTAQATARVTVTQAAVVADSDTADEVEEVAKEEKAETVTTTKVELDSELTTEVNDDTITNTMSKNAGDAIADDDSYTSADKALAEGVDEKNEATVKNLTDSGVFPADSESVPQDQVTVTPTANIDLAGTVAEDNAKAGRGASAPFMGFGVQSPRDGIVKIPTPRQPVKLWGFLISVLKTIANITPTNGAMPEGFTAAADDTDATVFLDSNGNVTTTIPTDTDAQGNPRIGGYMTIATYAKAGETYDMILSVPTEELDEAGVETTKTEVEVPLHAFTASGTTYFSTFVSSDLLTNTNYYRIGENVLTSKTNNVAVGEDWARTEEELAMAGTGNYTMITRLAEIDATAEAETHNYIVAANFIVDDAKRERIDTSENGGFIFYPNGPAGAEANVEVLKLVDRGDGTYGFDDLTPADIKNGVASGYLAFSVAGGETMEKPMLAVRLEAIEAPDAFSLSISQTSVTVAQGSTVEATLTPANNTGTVTYTASESWVTFNGNAVTFAPTASTAAGTYNVTITGTDGTSEASVTVTVTVTSSGSTPTPTTNLGLTASASTLTLRVGQTETITLTPSNLRGTATFSVTANEAVDVDLDENTGEAAITPLLAGTYQIVFTVTDSGRTTGSTATATVTLTATAGTVGSSGGGCDAGFGALALAVLGGFIAARKK